MKLKSKKKTLPFKIKWRTRKDEGALERPTIKTTEVLISGKILCCILLSIISAFIDIVFFSGLSKSGYPFFGVYVPAAIILSIMSIGFSGSKFFVAMQLAAIKEIGGRLKDMLGENYKHRLVWLKLKWNLIHKFLITISIITSISLSVITIGNGVRQMEQNIKNQTIDAQYLIDLKTSMRTNTTDKREAAKANIEGAKSAQSSAKEAVDKYWALLDDYQTKIRAVRTNDSLTDEDKDAQIAKIKKEAVNSLPVVTSKNVEYISKPEFEREFAKITKANETIDTSSLYEEAIAYDEAELNSYIIALQDKEYRTPDGQLIQFINEDGTPVNRELAIARLQNSIMAWQSDTGDAGPSSKVFTLVATYLKTDEKAGGMGTSEVIMMVLIMVFGIVQEFIIAAFTPRATISRKMLSQFSEYLYGVDINRFMLKTYKDYYDLGLLKSDEYERKCKKAVGLLDNNVDAIIAKYKGEDVENPEVVRLEAEVDKYKQQAEGYLATSADFHNKLMKETEKNEQLTNDMLAKDDLVQDLKYKLAQKENEIANLKVVEAPAVTEAKIEPVKVERKIERKIVKEPKEQEFSSAVDEKAKEVEALL